MARRLITLSRRLVLMLLLSHAVLLPVLFLALEEVVKRNVTNTFIDDARLYGRIVADSFGPLDKEGSNIATIELLDSAMLGGRLMYAALQYNEVLATSSLMDDDDADVFEEDFEFGEHGDDAYYVSLPIVQPNAMAILRLGFDEGLAREGFAEVRATMAYVLIAYLLVVLLTATYLSSAVVRPLQWLQQASRRIASGDYETKLSTQSQVTEIHELSRDLEGMRSKLVGINARLQQEIADRKTVEARLQQAQRLESLGTLAGGVAHEFNNVLQPILLYTDLALEDVEKGSAISSKLERVLDLAHRAKGLSHQILTFGRQGDETPLEVLPISPIVEEAATMIRALLPATVDIRADIDPDAGSVSCDAAQIQQLVVNLCNNAFQALETGGGHIDISLKRSEVSAQMAERHPGLNAGPYVVLEIADTGHGMDEETAARVFEPFFTTHSVGKGTGLGLSVVHGTVVRHAGEIALKSEQGNGTAFKIYLPLANT
jgi:signal transduction histidine kinase